MARRIPEGGRKVLMSIVGGVIVASMGAIEAATGVNISVACYATLASIFGAAMVGNGMEHIGAGMRANAERPTTSDRINSVLNRIDAVRAEIAGARTDDDDTPDDE